MPTAVADDALAELVCALEEVRPESLRSSVGALLEQRSFAPFVEVSRLVRQAREGRPRAEVLREVLRTKEEGGETGELDRFLLDSVALAALRSRRIFIGRELHHRWRRSDPWRPFRVASLGIGAHAEVLEFLAHESVEPSAVEATIVDGEPAELAAARARAEEHGTASSLAAVASDPRSLDAAATALAPQDVIVCPYQLDFLPDDEVLTVLDQALDRLAPGGELITANWHHDLTPRDRLVLEGFLGWTPTFREPKRIARAVRNVARARGVTPVGLLRGPNVYFVLQRTS